MSFPESERHPHFLRVHTAQEHADGVMLWGKFDRKLKGRFDKLVPLGRCLNDMEIQALHEVGTPYR
jgi:hypothetical protein